MSVPVWIDESALCLLHSESLAEFGGLWGIRDRNLLSSALARAQNLFTYEEIVSTSRLAAAYGYGITRNHPFNDGNKRAAFLAIGMFLALNGLELSVESAEAVNTMLALAAGEIEELELAQWIEMRCHKIS